jgi:L-lysine 6-transaminase
MTTTDARARIAPDQVHELLAKHILVDGFALVLDLARSHGVYLHDARGNRDLLDCFASFSTVPLGYNHPTFEDPEFRERILHAAINKPANSDLYTTEMAEFVATFSQTFPESLAHHLFFIDGGALAVENAMKAAFDWKKRKNLAAGRGELGNQIVHFREAFHGRSGYTLSVTNTDPNKTRYFPKFEWPRILNPKLSFPVTDEVLERVEREERQAIREIRQALLDNRHDVAAILIEPIQGEGGDNHFRAEFLRALREIADEEDVLLIYDEVQTGFGATGKWWGFEHFGVEPDILAFGKKTQVCGIAASRRIDEVESVFKVPSRINSTWGGNLVDMIRCQRIVETIWEEDLLVRATEVGGRMLDGLRGLEQRFDGRLSNSRGRGFFLAVDLPDGEARKRTLAGMRERGLLGLASGTRSIRFRPSLVFEREHAEEAIERLADTLETTL